MGQADTQFTLSFLAEEFSVDLSAFRMNAQNKGITISDNDETYISFNTIKIVDPSLAYKIKYRRTVATKAPKQSNVVNADSVLHEGIIDTDVLSGTGKTSTSDGSINSSDDLLLSMRQTLDRLQKMLELSEIIGLNDIHSIRKEWEMHGIHPEKRYKDSYKRYEFLLGKLYDAVSLND